MGSMLGLVAGKGLAGPAVGEVQMLAAFDPSSVYAGVSSAFEGALVVAASLTAALIIYRWVRRVFGR